MIISETSNARAAEEVANQHIKELELKRATEKRDNAPATPDANKVRQEDAERQRRFNEQQAAQEAEVLASVEEWVLPLEGTEAERRGIIERFRRDIEHCGWNFCFSKYQATQAQIKAEAARLKLRINWDRF